MKKYFTLFAVILFTVNTFAQTEQGKIRIGGNSKIGLLSTYYDNLNDYSIYSVNVNINGGYFFINNVSIDIGLYPGVAWSGENDYSAQLGGGLGLRYYFPIKVFLGSSFDIIHSFNNKTSQTMYGFNAAVGYAWFLSEKVAFEPSLNYRFDFAYELLEIHRLNVQIGISVYF